MEKYKYQELIGKKIRYICSTRCLYPTCIIVGIDKKKGISLVAMEDNSIRTCITPRYFGSNYEIAYELSIEMLKQGYFDIDKINKYALSPIPNNRGLLNISAPVCPYE